MNGESGKSSWRNSMLRMCVVLLGCLSLCAAASGERPLLTPTQPLTGARLSAQQSGLFGSTQQGVAGGYVTFMAPMAAVARNHVIYVADGRLRQIFRYDPAQLAMARFTDYNAAGLAGMVMAPDMSLYVADTATHKVLHFSWDGRLLRSFGSDNALVRPAGVVVDDATRQLYVADSLYNHVVVFNSLGRTLATLKSMEAHSIESMARGPDGLYLVDRVGRQVVVMGLDGRDRYAIGNEVLRDPRAITVDRFNRVFVSDDFDNTIKVFEQGELAASFSGGGAPFNRITHLSLDQNILYVADSLNGRIQVFHVALPREKGTVPE
jgi:hypothetical protein